MRALLFPVLLIHRPHLRDPKDSHPFREITMKTRQRAALVLFLVMMAICQAGPAMAANGALKFSFKYKDPITGVSQNLSSGFTYLHNASKSPPMEKFFTKADQILAGA